MANYLGSPRGSTTGSRLDLRAHLQTTGCARIEFFDTKLPGSCFFTHDYAITNSKRGLPQKTIYQWSLWQEVRTATDAIGRGRRIEKGEATPGRSAPTGEPLLELLGGRLEILSETNPPADLLEPPEFAPCV